MSRLMRDSTNPFDIPADTPMVAGYIDGLYAWPDAGWRRFPNSRKVTITTGSGTLDADVADVERYDYTPTSGAAWLRQKVNRDGYGTLYFSLSQFATVAAAVHAQGITDNQWGVWAAQWTGVAHLLPGSVATQYADSAMLGRHYDESLVIDYWPGVDPPPGYAPPPSPPGPPEHEVQLAWAKVGDILGSVLPGLNDAMVGTAVKLGEL